MSGPSQAIRESCFVNNLCHIKFYSPLLPLFSEPVYTGRDDSQAAEIISWGAD